MSGDSEGALNRFFIVVLALFVVFAVAVVIMLAWGAPDRGIERVADLADWLSRHNDRETKVIVTLGGAVVVLAMAMAIIVELTPSPTQRMRIRNVKTGDATITTREIADRIDAEAQRVEHIAECQSIVAARGRRVEVVLDLHVDAGADLTRASNEACARVRQLVEGQIGVELATTTRARLHYRELRLRGDAPQGSSPIPKPFAAGSEEERD
ncbi:MAG: hypothetical protein EPO22_10420 [Dehalococcoidia bacterium]|nr:MAG: hypothetical protein EPO22_10420 [Dehalococcoidia bacterium]